MKKLVAFFLVVMMTLSLVACGGDDKVVRTEEFVAEDGSVITHGYNKDDVHISEVVEMPDGSVYEHKYDTEGNHVSESATLADGSYHEFQYDKDGNVVNEIHK